MPFGFHGKKGHDNYGMKVALVAIAKDEDKYIEEWVQYYRHIGVDDVFIYQNNWRCTAESLIDSEHVHLVEWDGERQQIPAYNDFIRLHWDEYDFAMFFDVDEFLVVRGGKTLREFLFGFLDKALIGVNWRIFGDSGRLDVSDGNYSVVRRFIKCQNGVDSQVKTIMNLRLCGDRFLMDNPHYAAGLRWRNVMTDVCRRHWLHGPYNISSRGVLNVAYIAHFYGKTYREFCENKLRKGRADLNVSDDHFIRGRAEFDVHNLNETSDLSVQEMASSGKVDSVSICPRFTFRDVMLECRMRIRDGISWAGGLVLARKHF